MSILHAKGDIGGWALQGQDLGFAYPGAAPTFEHIDIGVRPREIVALLGGSGCGKSSLLPWLNVTANVGFGLDFSRQPKIARAEHDQRVQAAIEAVGLAGSERRYPAALSGGMAQRVALARALARQPALLFADEPFSALDAITRAEMQTLLVDVVHRWHSAVLLVTHDIDEAILVADRIVLMGGQPGRIMHEWQVDLPRPRLADAQAISALRLEILAALHGVRAAA